MTNKTVTMSRELAESLLKCLEDAALCGYPSPCEAQELRALLAATSQSDYLASCESAHKGLTIDQAEAVEKGIDDLLFGAAPVVERQDDDLSSELNALDVIGEYPSADDADAHDEWLDNNASTAIWLLGNLDRIRCALNSFPAPAVELDLVYNKMTEGLHIRRWENFGGLREGVHRLYTSPPAPVAVDERAEFVAWVRREWPQAPLSNVRDLLPKDDPRYGEYCDEKLQRAWVGWQARACLDKVKELSQ